MKPVQMLEAEGVAYVRRVGTYTGKASVRRAYLYQGQWWLVVCISARYDTYTATVVLPGEPLWSTESDALSGLVALASHRS